MSKLEFGLVEVPRKTRYRATLYLFFCSMTVVVSTANAADSPALIDKSVALIRQGQHSLARSYLAPALVDPRISSAVRSRAYYLRGFSFTSVGMPVSALRDFNRALEFNPANPAALFAAARSYWDGVAVEKDEALALGLFAQARELGHLGADLFIALGHLHGRGVEQNTTLGRARLTDLAADGNALAMSHLASSYALRQGVVTKLQIGTARRLQQATPMHWWL